MDGQQTKELGTGNTWHGYEIIEQIGQGGMGCVYKAVQVELKRTVALKITLAASSDISNRRFVREMEIAAQLNHPNICKIYDAGIIDGQKYMVMDYIEGESLKEYLKKHDLCVEEKLRLLMKICVALGYAHRRKIVHRDLKPENIMMNANGEPMVIDFGLARRVDTSEFDLTKTGDILGTPYYMAPEQIAGLRKNITHQVDIYALGVILYELLTGKRMIEGGNVFEIMCRIQDKNYVPLCKQNPALSKDLHTIWEKATYQNRKHRYANVDLFAADLKAFLDNKRIKKSYHKQIRTLSYSVAIFCVAFITFLLLRQDNNVRETIVLSSKEQKISQHFDSILFDINNRDFDSAQQKYRKQKFSTGQYLLLVKELYERAEYDRAFELLSKVANRTEAKYYKAIILYHREQYSAAEKLLRQLPEHANKNYYLGLCLFRMWNKSKKSNLWQEALALLEKVENKEDINILEALALIHHHHNNKSKQAKKYLQMCVEKEPYVPLYSIMLARMYLQEQKPYAALVLMRKILSVESNLNAYEVLHEIPYYEPTLNRECYQAIINGFFGEIQLQMPRLFLRECTAVQQSYHDRYLLWQTLQNVRQSSLEAVLHKLDNASREIRKLSQKVIMNQRYAKNFHSQIENFIAQTSSATTTDFLQKLQRQIQLVKNKEILAMILYKLARIEQSDGWKQGQWSEADSKIFSDYLTATNLSAFEKYLLAKGVLHFSGMKPLLAILQDENADLVLRTVIAATLREHHLAADIRVFFQLPQVLEKISSTQEKEFLQTLVARSMYIPHAYKLLDTTHRQVNSKQHIEIPQREKDLLLYLMTNSSVKVRIVAAGSLYCLTGEKEQITQLAAKVLVQGMRAKYNSVRAHAHYMFWQKNSTIPQQHVELYRKGLKDPSAIVKKTVLSFHFKMSKHISQIKDELVVCLGLLPRVRRLALFALVMDEKSEKLIFEEDFYAKISRDFLPIEHSLVFLSTLYRVFDNLRSTNKTNFAMLTKLLAIVKYMKTYGSSLPYSSQCMVTYVSTLFNVHNDSEYLEKITNPFLLAYMLFQLHQETPFVNQVPISLVKSPSRKERKRIVRKFLQYAHPKIRNFARVSYIALGSEKEIENHVRKVKKRPQQRRFVAMGIYGFVHNRWTDSVKLGQGVAMSANARTIYLGTLRKTHQFLQDKKNKADKKKAAVWFDLMCNLDAECDRYFFERGFLFNQQNALHNIDKAIAINENYRGGYLHLLYCVEGAKIAMRHKQGTQKYLQKLQTNFVHPWLFSDIANVYMDAQELSKALRVYERNFLATQKNFELFSQIFTEDLQMVHIHLQQQDENTARILLEYLYQIFRRANYNTDNHKDVFVKTVKAKLTNFTPFVDRWWEHHSKK